MRESQLVISALGSATVQTLDAVQHIENFLEQKQNLNVAENLKSVITISIELGTRRHSEIASNI